MIIVDTHAHIYDEDETTYPKKENPLRPPKGTGGIVHLRQEMVDNGVAKAVLVQTGSAYGWDNRLSGDVAKENADDMVGVCTLDPAFEGSVGQYEKLVLEKNVKGLRVEPTKTENPVYDHAGSDRLWRKVREVNGVVCAHIQAQFLVELAQLLRRYPDVPVVLDHAAYPKAGDGVDSDVVNGVVELAEFANLNVKLTFAVTGSDEAYPFGDMHAIVRRIVDVFGADRCMWGSDFPCELWLKKSTYAQHLDLFRQEIELSTGEREAILGGTAMRIWFA